MARSKKHHDNSGEYRDVLGLAYERWKECETRLQIDPERTLAIAFELSGTVLQGLELIEADNILAQQSGRKIRKLPDDTFQIASPLAVPQISEFNQLPATLTICPPIEPYDPIVDLDLEAKVDTDGRTLCYTAVLPNMRTATNIKENNYREITPTPLLKASPNAFTLPGDPEIETENPHTITPFGRKSSDGDAHLIYARTSSRLVYTFAQSVFGNLL